MAFVDSHTYFVDELAYILDAKSLIKETVH